MKNKEIEELLNELKEYANGGMSGLYPSEDTIKNFVSYIEQLENNRDKAIEIIEPLVEWGECSINGKILKQIYNILKGDNDE